MRNLHVLVLLLGALSLPFTKRKINTWGISFCVVELPINYQGKESGTYHKLKSVNVTMFINKSKEIQRLNSQQGITWFNTSTSTNASYLVYL
ncbi:hypothetical protein AAZX31_02G068600 [Glycine max]